MNPTEHNAHTPSTPKTGLLASLCARLRTKGSGAPKTGLIALAAVFGALAFAAVPALAAAPEAPKTEPATAVTTTTATVHGVLDPKKASTELVVEYGFFYAPRGAACTEAFFAPESPGMATGKLGEKVEVALAGLEPSTEYAVCLAARNPGEEAWTVGNAVPFTTKAAPPTATTEPATGVKATEARFEGLVNPNNQTTECNFQYGTEPALVVSTTVGCEPETLEGFGGQGVGLTVAGLAQNTTYYYRVLAKNAKSEETKGTVEHFTTAITPETPEKLEAKPIAASTATLTGVLNPGKAGNPGSYEFFYKQSASECQGENQKTTPATPALGGKEEAAQAPVTELLPHTTYTFCLRVANEAGEEALSAPVTFTTLAAPPTIEEQFVTEVASTSVTLNAKLNPQGAATTYTFEYAPAGGAFSQVPEPDATGSLPEGTTGVPVEVHMQHGLAPNTAYEFRLVAHNSVETVTGEPVSFTTQRTGTTSALPDNRQREMVTPPDKHGTLFSAFQVGSDKLQSVIQASVHGDAIIDQASQPSEAEPQGYNNETQELSTRGPSGWSSQSLQAPHAEAAGPSSGLGDGQEYHFFSADLSLGVVDPVGNSTALSPQASEATPYIRTNYLNGNVTEHCESSYLSATSCFRPLVSGCPAAPTACSPSVEEHADVSRGTEFGEELRGHCKKIPCGPNFIDATPDLSHVLLTACSLVPGIECEALTEQSFYEWSDGQLQPLPDELAGLDHFKDQVGAGQQHAISVNGQRVLLQSDSEVNATLYLRDTDLPAKGDPNAQTTTEIGVGEFDTASADDSRIFFTGYPSRDLFEYDLNAEVGHRLTDLTEGVGVSQVFGASEDGSYVYFTAAGALPGTGAAPSTCTNESVASQAEVEAASCNVYLRHDGVTTLIGPGGPVGHEARVSPDGRWLAFMSDRNLTGYDTRDAVDGHLDQEVYLYHADTGGLVCASCDPTGARPAGFFDEELSAQLLGVAFKLNHGAVASSVPEWHSHKPAEYQPRYLSDSGRLFFNSDSALVPQDINGAEDVYEYEPAGFENSEGRPQCTPSSGTFSERAQGCVSLLSSGASAQNSAFLDASENGSDVFFLTTSKLAPQDYDTAPDVYDAHECTSASPCTPAPAAEPQPCITEASCKPAPATQPSIFGASGSATFSGPGNIAPTPAVVKPKAKVVKCKKGFVKNRQGKCIKNKKRKKNKHKAKKARRASNDRRPSR